MQEKTFDKISDAFIWGGALVFAVLLVIELSRDNLYPAQIIFSAAMLTLCLGDMVRWLPIRDAARSLTRVAMIIAAGLALAVSFTVIAFRAESVAEQLFATFVACLGVYTLATVTRRIRIRRVPSGTDGQR